MPSAPQGSGPFGVITPADMQRTVAQVRSVLASTTPRISALLELPGSADIVNGLVAQLSRRLAARAIKFVFGAQQTLSRVSGGGGSGPGPGPGSGPQPLGA